MFVIIANALVLMALSTHMLRSAHQKPAWAFLAWFALGHLAFWTVHAVLLLPFLWLLAGVSFPPQPKPHWPRATYFAGFALAVVLGLAVSSLRAESPVTSQLAALLRPVLGARWFSNGVWVLIVSSAALFWWPTPGARIPSIFLGQGKGILRSLRTVIVLLDFVVLAWANLYVWILPGQIVLGQFLHLVLLFLLAVTAGLFAATMPGKRKVVYLAAMIGCLVFAWFNSQGFPLGSRSSAIAPGVFPTGIGNRDLLFIHRGEYSRQPFNISWPLASTGQVRFFNALPGLKSTLKSRWLEQDHAAIWVLGLSEGRVPWLVLQEGRGNWSLAQLYSPALSRTSKIFPLLDEEQKEWEGVEGGLAHEGLNTGGIWTTGQFSLVFRHFDPTADSLLIHLQGWRSRASGSLFPGFLMELNGKPIPARRVLVDQILADIPAGLLINGPNTLQIHCPTFVPSQVDTNATDKRKLGLDLESIEIK